MSNKSKFKKKKHARNRCVNSGDEKEAPNTGKIASITAYANLIYLSLSILAILVGAAIYVLTRAGATRPPAAQISQTGSPVLNSNSSIGTNLVRNDSPENMDTRQKKMRKLTGDSERNETEISTKDPARNQYKNTPTPELTVLDYADLISRAYTYRDTEARAEIATRMFFDEHYKVFRKKIGLETSTGFHYLLSSAEEGEPESQFHYAMLQLGYDSIPGHPVEIDKNTGMVYLRKSAAQSFVLALIGLAREYQTGKNIPKDLIAALEYYEKASVNDKSGFSDYQIGFFHEFGLAGEKFAGKALEYYERSYEKGNVQGIISFANCYYSGIGTAQNYARAKRLFDEVAEKDETGEAFFRLGLCYEFGDGVALDKQNAREHYIAAAVRNNIRGLLRLGYFYYEGIGGEHSIEKAEKLFEKAKQEDETGYALYMIGTFYRRSVDAVNYEENKKKALDYYRLSAEKGNVYAKLEIAKLHYRRGDLSKEETFALFDEIKKKDETGEAYFMLGSFHEKGYGTNVDAVKAFEHYELSAEKGNVLGRSSVARCHVDGLGTTQDVDRGLQLWLKAAEEDETGRAYRSLGRRYEEGVGIKKDSNAAFRYYMLSARSTNGFGVDGIFNPYYRGENIDYKKAFELFAEAEKYDKTGNSLYMLGICYATGRGVERDHQKAFTYFEESAKREGLRDLSRLAFMYRVGLEGVAADYGKALEFYKLAVNIDDSGEALFVIGAMYLEGLGVEENPDIAVTYFERSEKCGYVSAMLQLADCYYKGLSVPKKNHQRALELYKKAAEIGKSGMANIGIAICYEFGDEEVRDHKKSFDFLSKTLPDTFLGFACRYYYAVDVEHNYDRAVLFLENAIRYDKTGEAYRLLSECYHFGRGVPINMQLATDNARLSSEQEKNYTADRLFSGSYQGILGLAQKTFADTFPFKRLEYRQKDFDLFNRAIGDDDTGQMLYIVGRCYLTGYGVAKNQKTAFEYFKQASDKSYFAAIIQLASCYYNAIGTEQNSDEAYKQYKRAEQIAKNNLVSFLDDEKAKYPDLKLDKRLATNNAEHRDVGLALYYLGICYETGIGVERNADKAFEQYKSAADHGSISGLLKLAQCYYSGIGVERNYKTALELYNEAAWEDKSGEAFRMMGVCYDLGNGVAKNPEKAAEYFKIAEQQRKAKAEESQIQAN